MVLLHIVCENREQAQLIVDQLIDEKLVFDTMISENLLFRELKRDEKRSHKRTLVMGTTKALLFKQINEKIREQHSNQMPLVYAMPIVYMDEQQTLELKKETLKV